MAATLIGWDVGGAHLKAALLRGGVVADVLQLPCALWQGLDRLDAALADALARLGAPAGARHAATMTGELADNFAHREHGVGEIVRTLATRLDAHNLRLFAADGWAAPPQATARWRVIASANWLASARWVARRHADALFVDVGSTTTDLVPIVGGAVASANGDDAARLASGELVYQGAVRTPLCALGPRVVFRGAERNVMNEFFATAADVYRLTGELDAAHDQYPPADGGAKDRAATQARLARMIGLDARDASDGEWRSFAIAWRQRQRALLRDNAARVVAASGVAPSAPVVGAGCGDFLARALANALQRPYVGFDALLPLADASLGGWARVAAPCVAVALLAHEEADACGW